MRFGAFLTGWIRYIVLMAQPFLIGPPFFCPTVLGIFFIIKRAQEAVRTRREAEKSKKG